MLPATGYSSTLRHMFSLQRTDTFASISNAFIGQTGHRYCTKIVWSHIQKLRKIVGIGGQYSFVRRSIVGL